MSNTPRRRRPSVREVNRTEKDGNRFHYYVVAGEILFATKATEPDGVDTVTQRRLNSIVATHLGYVSETVLQQAQQSLQMNLLQEINGQVEIDVAAVTILSMSYLGFMTEAEFHDRKKS